MRSRVNLENVISFIVGNYRYCLYYSKQLYGYNLSWLLRKHIKEQYEVRLGLMDRECYESGQCKVCGCHTTMLQMANKACEGGCYGEMLGKREWGLVRNKFIN